MEQPGNRFRKKRDLITALQKRLRCVNKYSATSGDLEEEIFPKKVKSK